MSEATDFAEFLQQSVQTALASLGIPEPVATEGSEGYSSARLVSVRLMPQAGRGGDFDQYQPVQYTGSRPKPDPTPEEIAAECAAIRAEWPASRWQQYEREQPAEIPEVKLDKRRNGELM
jgi:hypothetical protein